MAMRGPAFMGPLEVLGLGRDDFAAVIVAARRTQIVRQLELAAVRAFLERRRLQRMVAAAHVALGRRCFSLRDSHAAPLKALSSIKIATISASSRRVRTRGGGWIVANRGSYRERGRGCKGGPLGATRASGGSSMTPLSVLLATAACVLLNIWLGMRIARLRRDLKVSVGDGGHDLLLRRMRAQATFIENAPFVLI